MSSRAYLQISECKRGHIYRIASRNLAFGLFVPEHDNGFIGIREKFGERYLFTEHHWDNGPPFGTARPLEDLGLIEDPTIPFEESGPLRCRNCGNGVRYQNANGSPSGWRHLDPEVRCAKAFPTSDENERLFQVLEKIELLHTGS